MLHRVARNLLVVLVASICCSGAAQESANWPQFRGPNCAGVAAFGEDPPIQLTDQHLLWKSAVPPGHGSPCIWGKQLFISGFERQNKKFRVISFDRQTGVVQWSRDIPTNEVERVHQVNSPASSTVACDGERLYAYFASIGLLCFDMNGQSVWECRLPIPKTPFGSGTSSIVAGDVVLLNRDAEDDAFLLAVDRRTGNELWRHKLPAVSFAGRVSYSTPVLWNGEIVLHRMGEVSGYDLKSGERTWWYTVTGSGTATPVIGNDALFVNTWNNFGEPELRVELPSFNELLKRNDTNADKKLSKDEFPEDLAISRRPEVSDEVPGAQFFVKPMFDRLDANKDQQLTGLEWLAVRVFLSTLSSDHGLVAIRGGGKGDVTRSHSLWRENRGVAEVPSPLFANDRVYMVKDGGIVSCLDAVKGTLIYRERLGGPGAYHASPVMAKDRIYIASTQGVVTVFSAGDAPEVLAKMDLKESILATPALVDNCVYLRTGGHVMAFGKK